MDLSGFMDSIISFAQNNTIIAIVVALGSPLLLVSEAETVFCPSLPWSLPVWIVLYDHEHGRFGLSAEEKTPSARGKATRLKKSKKKNQSRLKNKLNPTN